MAKDWILQPLTVTDLQTQFNNHFCVKIILILMTMKPKLLERLEPRHSNYVKIRLNSAFKA